uniref:Uncharacterized protein n=2 Tax=Oryza TaxID=4527 RepID=A0A0E0NV40_ORYRU
MWWFAWRGSAAVVRGKKKPVPLLRRVVTGGAAPVTAPPRSSGCGWFIAGGGAGRRTMVFLGPPVMTCHGAAGAGNGSRLFPTSRRCSGGVAATLGRPAPARA